MQKISTLKQNRKGQVFLLLAIVILIYLILLSTTVYRITQSPYIEPTPNQEQLLNYVDNSISAIFDITEYALAQFSVGVSRSTIVSNMEIGVQEIADFLFAHNLPSYIEIDTDLMILQKSSTSINPVYVTLELNASIIIDSPELYYQADFNFKNSYFAEISEVTGTENFIYLYKTYNEETILVNTADIEISPITPVINIGDGSYQADLEVGQTITITFPSNLVLVMEI